MINKKFYNFTISYNLTLYENLKIYLFQTTSYTLYEVDIVDTEYQ